MWQGGVNTWHLSAMRRFTGAGLKGEMTAASRTLARGAAIAAIQGMSQLVECKQENSAAQRASYITLHTPWRCQESKFDLSGKGTFRECLHLQWNPVNMLLTLDIKSNSDLHLIIYCNIDLTGGLAVFSETEHIAGTWFSCHGLYQWAEWHLRLSVFYLCF